MSSRGGRNIGEGCWLRNREGAAATKHSGNFLLVLKFRDTFNPRNFLMADQDYSMDECQKCVEFLATTVMQNLVQIRARYL